MSLYILAHPWEVQDVADGTVVPITHRDLDVETLSIMAEELCELAHENNLPKLYLDFQKVTSLTSVALQWFSNSNSLPRMLYSATLFP